MTKSTNSTLGLTLLNMRKRRKLTQKIFAARLGLNSVSLCQYETGVQTPSLENFALIWSASSSRDRKTLTRVLTKIAKAL